MAKKKLSLFYKGLLIYVIILVCLCAVGLALFADYLYNYERSLPENYAEGYILTLGEEPLHSIMKEVYPAQLEPIEDREAVYSEVYKGQIEGKLEFHKAAGIYKEDAPAFNVFSEKGTKLFLLKLAKNGEYRYGLPKWSVSTVEPYAEEITVEKFDFTLSVPFGSQVKINENGVSDDYIFTESSNNCYISEFDALIVNENEYTVYTFEDLSIVPDISVIFNGSQLENYHHSCTDTTQKRVYIYPGEEFRTVEFKAPSATTVSVNGIVVSEKYVVNSTEISEMNAFENEKQVTLNTYRIEGLMADAEISVLYCGKELTATDSGEFTISNEEKREIIINAPSGSKITVNGIEVSKEYAKDTSETYGVLKEIEKYISNTENITTYLIKGFYYLPEVIASLEGVELTLISSSDENGTAVYDYVKMSDEVANKDAAQTAETFLRDYVYYVGSGHSGIDDNHEKVMSYMLAGSPGYKLMRKTYDAVKWNSRYGTIKYAKLEKSNFVIYHENAVGCTISFDVTLTDGYRHSRNYVDSIALIMIKTEGAWKIADITFGAD